MLTAESRERVDAYWGMQLQRVARSHKVSPGVVCNPKIKGRKVAAARRELVMNLAKHVWTHVVKHDGRTPVSEVGVRRDVRAGDDAFDRDHGWQPLSTTLIAELFGMHHSAIVTILNPRRKPQKSQPKCQGVAQADGAGVP